MLLPASRVNGQHLPVMLQQEVKSVELVYYVSGSVGSCLELSLKVCSKGTMVGDVLDMGTVGYDTAIASCLLVLLTGKLGKPPLVRDDDLLASRELVLAAPQGLNDDGPVGILGADRDEDLSDVDPCNDTVRFTEGTPHTRLQTISTGAGKHLVDADDMEWVDADAHVERILPGELGNVLVRCNTGSLEGLA